ncbi:unnamed protein product [Ilex paraguariensis]|uniref:HIG1 domain-containing protein n=1 Tax=Ilex paraguariensis TaxID=185542 RepID=A0ABC8RPV0_9AQUA
MAKSLGPTGEFFWRMDEWRKHAMLTNQLRHATPGLGIAVVAFGVTGTNRGVLQEKGRVEEVPDADQLAPPGHSWPRHSRRRLRHLPRRRSLLQQDLRSRSLSLFVFFRFSHSLRSNTHQHLSGECLTQGTKLDRVYQSVLFLFVLNKAYT